MAGTPSRGTKHLRADGQPKSGFVEREGAVGFKWHIVNTTGTSPDGLRAYRCEGESDSCGLWHVGHYDPRNRQITRWKRRRRG